MSNLTKLIQRRRVVRLAFIMGLALLFTTALLWGLSGMPLAHATPTATVRYVDGNSGSDAGNCTNSASPCQTIQYAIDQSVSGDEIRVAQGTYTETIDVVVTLTLKGGYESSGWTRDIAANPTIIDANGADTNVVNIQPGINVTIEGFTLQGANHTSDNGGGLAVNGASVIISATIVQNNVTSGGSGGGIWYEGDGTSVTLVNSLLLNNSASNSGGGIAGCCGNNTVTLDNTDMQGNTAQNWGGGLNISSGSVNIINNSQIISNTATTSQGGGICTTPGVTLTLANAAILTNTAGDSGGGLFLNNSMASLDNVNISGNQSGAPGGGVALFQATAVFTNGQIANNTASTGGGLWQESASATLNSVIVQGNQATNSGYAAGGGVDTNNSSLTLNDSVLADNVVQSTGGGETLGGAINNNSGSVAMTNSIIRNNNSQGTPVVQIYQAALTVTNSLVADNQGPGFAGTPTQGSFTNVTIANNNGFGLGIGPLETGDPPVNVTIANSIFWGNGGGDYFCDTSVGTVNCTLSYSDVGTGDTTGTGNLSADPLFVDDANGDYHLGVGSPAVDKGTAVGAPGDDLDGNLRDAAPDMGAYEWVGFRIFLPMTLKNFGP